MAFHLMSLDTHPSPIVKNASHLLVLNLLWTLCSSVCVSLGFIRLLLPVDIGETGFSNSVHSFRTISPLFFFFFRLLVLLERRVWHLLGVIYLLLPQRFYHPHFSPLCLRYVVNSTATFIISTNITTCLHLHLHTSTRLSYQHSPINLRYLCTR